MFGQIALRFISKFGVIVSQTILVVNVGIGTPLNPFILAKI